MVLEEWLLGALVLIIFPMSLSFLYHKKRGFREMVEVDESNDQELTISDDSAEGHEYEVFLSFRGVDTRKNITDHLYSYLSDLRIHTFRDNEELHVGKKIGRKLMKAIEQSKIFIPILSKGYASSKWCLMELTHMVKCVEDSKERTMIYPIFYDVTPSEVRNQKGSFEKDFDGHMKKFDKETVDEWKKALKTVSDLKGWEKDQIANGHEAELVKEVGSKVVMELKKMHVELPEHLVGMDQHEAALMQLLDLDCDDVKIVGIVGMGGIGKTTIAKFIYNKLCDQFLRRSSFLENVREKVNQSEGLNDLKKQLMSDILPRKSDERQMNRSTFKSTKALIVLDDVMDRSQLDKIIGGCDWFGPGSRIIVTTRNRDTFLEEKGDKIFNAEVMNSENSLSLFCKHAFRQDFPWEGYEDLSEKIVSRVAGLPLSLKVIGSPLSKKKREVWEDTLKKLEKIMPEKIQEILRISYDMLEGKEPKQIFLDIACHFLYSDEDTRRAASYMWEDRDFFPVSGIDHLITHSLVKVDENGRFWMHDQLRDLGREIVRKENPDNPGRRSRLWSYKEALDVLTRKTGTEYVQTLTLHEWYKQSSYDSEVCLSTEEFKGLSELRYLDLSTVSILEGDFKGLLSNLRWFCFNLRSQIPEIANFCLPKLVVLDLSFSNISDGWEEKVIQIMEATNLKILNLSSCYRLTKTPDLSRFSKLERLNLAMCSDLVEISPSIGHLQNLNYLNLSRCPKLGKMWSKLPEFFWKLKSLVELDMKHFRAVTELSEDIRNLANLKILDVQGTEIKKLPNEFGKLEKLEEFNASECRSLRELPESIGNLRSLKRLDISDSGVNWLPESIGNLRSLILLCIRKTGVKRLPSAIGRLEKLEELDASDCKSLRGELPSGVWSLSALRELKLNNTRISSLGAADLSRFSHLTTLDLGSCPELRLPPTDLKLPPGLTRLEIPLTKASLDSVASLTKLKILGFHLCDRILTDESVQSPIDLGGLSRHKLNSLNFHGFRKFTSLPVEINNLPWMRCLAINTNADDEGMVALEDGCEFLERLPDLPNTLKRIKARECQKLIHTDGGLAGLASVVELDIGYCSSLRSLPDFSVMQRLEKLRIDTCRELTDLDGLAGLTSLVELGIFSCTSLHSLPDFSDMQRLKKLVIHACPKLSHPLQGVEGHTSLEEVCIEDLSAELYRFPMKDPLDHLERLYREVVYEKHFLLI